MSVAETRLSETGHVVSSDLDLDATAILLDVDGTLIEIAATPQEVRIPPTLRHILAKLRDRLSGALCLVSGRPITDLDRMFSPLQVAIVGGHGAETRLTPGGEIKDIGPTLDAELRTQLLAVAACTPGLIAEEKKHSLALHYRLVPELEKLVWNEIHRVIAGRPPDAIEVLPGKAVFEVKPRAFSKGAGIRNLMRHEPFAGRRPIFVGDDVTDESALAVLPEFNGCGFSVGRKLRGAQGFFGTPREVRHWLYGFVGAGARG